MDTKSAAANNPTAESAPRNTTSDADPQQKPEEPRMIGDFDGNAGEFWNLFKAYKLSTAQSVIVGVIDFPNGGKSSLINILKWAKVHGFSILMVQCVQLWRSQGKRRNRNQSNSSVASGSSTLQVLQPRIYPQRFRVVAGKLLQVQRRRAKCSDETWGDGDRDL